MNRLKHWALFIVLPFIAQNSIVFCMEDSEEEWYIPEHRVHFPDDFDAVKKNLYSVKRRWQDYKYIGGKNLVESLIKGNIVECYDGGDRQKIGAFDGVKKTAQTFFPDGYQLYHPYDDFIELILGEEAKTLSFRVGRYLYDIHGNKIAAGTKISTKKRGCVIS